MVFKQNLFSGSEFEVVLVFGKVLLMNLGRVVGGKRDYALEK